MLGPRRNIAIIFDVEKLEWCGYPTLKNFGRYVYSFRQNTGTWDTQTDGQTPHAWRRGPRLHSIAWKTRSEKATSDIRIGRKKLYQWKGRPDPHNPSYGFAMQWHSNLCFTRSSAAAKRPRDAPCHWKSCCHPKSLKAILLVFHCNDVSISYRFWDIQLWILARPWNLG